MVALIAVVDLVDLACGDGDSTDDPQAVLNGDGGVAANDAAHEIEGAYLVNASAFAGKSAADWSNAKVVRVELDEFEFRPNDLTFEAGQPYKVELVNVGAVKHEFTAEDLFASVAWRKAESAESEVKAPFFTDIEVFAGKQVDLYFVPMVPSPFDLVCELGGHLKAGMFGTATVTGDAPTDPVPVYAPFADGPWADNGAEVVSEADWSTMETVEIDLGEFYFEPNEVRLKAG